MLNKLGRIYCQRCASAKLVEQELLRALRDAPDDRRRAFDAALGRTPRRATSTKSTFGARVGAGKSTRAARRKDGCSVELLLRQTRSSYTDHTLLASLVISLGEAGTIDARRLQAMWHERRDFDTARAEEKERREALLRNPVALRGAGARAFSRRRRERPPLFDEGKSRLGVHARTRGGARRRTTPPQHLPRRALLRKGKKRTGAGLPSRALTPPTPRAARASALGLACGEEARRSASRELLVRETLRRAGRPFAAHFALGRPVGGGVRLEYVRPRRVQNALSGAPARRPLHARLSTASSGATARAAALSKAVESDSRYGELTTSGWLCLRLGEKKKAAAAFAVAKELGAGEAGPRAAGKKTPHAGQIPAPPLAAAGGRDRRRLITGGESRIAAALREDVLGGGPPR